MFVTMVVGAAEQLSGVQRVLHRSLDVWRGANLASHMSPCWVTSARSLAACMTFRAVRTLSTRLVWACFMIMNGTIIHDELNNDGGNVGLAAAVC